VLLAVVADYAKNSEKNLQEIIKGFGIEKFSEEKIRKTVKSVIEKNAGLVAEKKMGAIGALMGDIMRELKGKASGSDISKILKEELSKEQ
ncbi:MAG: GatB/YqeY domain-containing protein, partial [Candidatus Diapherotrites archaeon]|nr:GatB/YqeY domain-containing protein [Candidatus Diapherotrites archaeon]